MQSKFSIIHDISSLYQSKIESSRQDFFSIVIIILISLELAMVLIK
jgi:hypothetical protein